LPIIGYSITNVSANRKPVNQIDKLDINSSVKITNVEEKTITFPDKSEALGIRFEFNTTYKPELAKLEINGEVLFTDKSNKKTLELWKKKKALPENVDIEVKNFLFRRCLTIGINLTQELQLPPPVIFPMIAPKEENKSNYIG